jgi:hypothetical protein
MPTNDDLIDRLTADLKPTRTVSPWLARAMLLGVALLTVAAIIALFGMRPDFIAGRPSSVPLMSELVILCAGGALAAALTAMARPAVGATRNDWPWAVAALSVLPIAALVTAAGDSTERAVMLDPDGLSCLVTGTIASITSIVLLTLWMQRGAPSSPNRAAWLIGIVSGAIGALAMGLVCRVDAIAHIGIWHVGIVALAAAASRLAVPRFLRW